MRFALPIGLLIVAAGCGVETETVLRDLPVDLEDRDWEPPIVGDPAVQVGVMSDQLFRELEDGSDIAIEKGLQGGRWIHVSVRTTGLRRSGSFEAWMYAEGEGEPVGHIAASLRLNATREGYAEVPQVPVPFVGEWEGRFEELYGRDGSLRFRFTDSEGVNAEKSLDLVFIEG